MRKGKELFYKKLNKNMQLHYYLNKAQQLCLLKWLFILFRRLAADDMIQPLHPFVIKLKRHGRLLHSIYHYIAMTPYKALPFVFNIMFFPRFA
ncbi:MAG: hypothetical protein OQL06_07385 [Gammaproteobacteria bacterium]|nr:hypothetical protein [Gammaproteobacteria bacterium]